MTDRSLSTADDLSAGDSFAGRGGHHAASALDSIGEGRRGPGNAASDILGDIFKSIMDGPPRLGHPANPRERRYGNSPADGGIFGAGPFGRSPFDLDDLGPSALGGRMFGSGPSSEGLDMLADIFGDEALDEILGPAKISVTAIGPDGIHRVGTFEGKASDWRALTEGRDALGIADALKAFEENPPSRNQRKLSMLSELDGLMPLAYKVYTYAGHAGAEIARFLKDPDANKDFAFINHLAGVLKKAQTDDKEAFGNLKKRLKEYSIDLDGLIAKINAFVAKPAVNTAKSVQMRMATAAPIALGLLDDVEDDMKSIREKLKEKLRSTSKI